MVNAYSTLFNVHACVIKFVQYMSKFRDGMHHKKGYLPTSDIAKCVLAS